MKTSLLLALLVALPLMLTWLAPAAVKQYLGDMTLNYMSRTGMLLWDSDPEVITRELKRIGDDVKELGTKALAEAEKAGVLSKETKAAVDDMLIKQGELQARLQDVEQKQDKAAAAGGDPETKTIGQQFVESDELKEYLGKNNQRDNSVSFGVKAITSLANSAGDGAAPDRLDMIVANPERRLTVRDLITAGRTSSNAIQYLKETGFTNSAAVQAGDGAQKAESDITFDLINATVVTIAHFIKASKQILDDFPQLQSYIDGRLRYGLALAEELQLLKGSGSGNNLNGILTQATAYNPAIALSSPTRIDVLRLALLQAELAEYPSTGIVLNPADWAAIELQKDSTGSYIFANPQGNARPALWGRPVVPTQAQTADQFLVGAFQLGAQVFDREDANVVIATQNKDDFEKNMITIRGEERIALAVYRPEAFVKGDITPT